MRRQIAVVMCSAVFGLMTLSSHAIAQQKTAKECREEWKANKTANQANGITEKAYVAQCRGGASPTAAPASPAAPTPAPTQNSDGSDYGTKDSEGMPGRVESEQGCQSGERRYRKGLRSPMPRRRFTHCRSGATGGSYSRSYSDSDGSDYGTKDCEGMPGRVESEQGCQSGERRYRKGLRSPMPRRRFTHCRSGTASGPCSDGSHSSPQTHSSAAPDRRTQTRRPGRGERVFN